VTLADFWFVLFVLIVAGYLILDGFDMGVGILHLPLARDDAERRTFLNSIGPVWDGNEVWLVLAGGVLFAVFPLVYASLFSGFYLAFMLVLLVMILRTVAIEFRSKERSPRWRSTWDTVFWAASLGLALLLGIAFGNILSGVPIDADGNMQVSLIDLLNPFSLLVGVTAVAMFAMHGAIFLSMKTDGELLARIEASLPRLIGAFFVLNTLVVVAMVLFRQQITARYTSDIWPVIFPAAALIALIAAWSLLRRGRRFHAFVASAATIGLLIISGAIGLYPNLLISTTDPANNLTVTNAAAADNTLTVALIVAVIGIPFVLLYTAGVYYFFRGKTVVAPDSY
jgi:cytochrome d ubiquinol oxidase subunit II